MTNQHDQDLLAHLARSLACQARLAGHRRLMVLSGGSAWCHAQAACLHDVLAPEQVLWLGNTAPEGVKSLSGKQVLERLGTESNLLVVDAWAGFDPDAFGAATGTLMSGGLALLLVPPLPEWPAFPDPELRRIAIAGVSPEQMSGRFIQRLVTTLLSDPDVVIVREGQALSCTVPACPLDAAAHPVAPSGPGATPEQSQAVEAVLQVVLGHRRRPLVLTADRGRGKSAALGLAVAQMAKRSIQGAVLVTAPRRQAVDAIYRHAGNGANLRYLTPDQLLTERPVCALLLVDEAAGLPVATLAELLRHYPRVVFASTVHGYEGTGQGFKLRFRARLDALAPGWRSLHLTTPIRWSPDDPLEGLTFRALLLDAAMAQLPEQVDGAECVIRLLDRDALVAEPACLEALFGLLVQAHYRTRPLDLRNLLDGAGVTIHAAFLGQALVGAALAVREGGFDTVMADAIWTGRRRPHGHLLAQSLATHVGLRTGAKARMLRIMRLAVHPGCRRQGLGAALLQSVLRQAETECLNVVGTSYGATPELLAFWSACGLSTARVGSRRDVASGSHSVLMLCGVDAGGKALAAEGVVRFASDFPVQLGDPLKTLDPAVALALLVRLPAWPLPDVGDWESAATFAWGRRDFAVCLPALRCVTRWGLTRQAVAGQLETPSATALVQRLLQSRDWENVAASCGVCGRAAVLDLLRQAIGVLVCAGAPKQVISDPVFQLQR